MLLRYYRWHVEKTKKLICRSCDCLERTKILLGLMKKSDSNNQYCYEFHLWMKYLDHLTKRINRRQEKEYRYLSKKMENLECQK